MNTKSLGKIILLYTIATNITKADSQKTPALVELFKYGDDSTKQKEIQLKENEATAFLTNKPTGLQRTVLDLDFPEGPASNDTDSRFRIVQCLAVGHIDYIQKKTYKKVALKLTAKDPYTDVQSKQPACTNTIILTLSPPGTINTDNVLTNVYKIFQKEVALKKDEPVTLVFEDVLDTGFLKMDLFWVNFEIKGKCCQYLEVELLQPQNTSLTGGKEITETKPQVPPVQPQPAVPGA
ncbi:hypothetical protein MACJ_002925 [Theileria orientalis]|uniref:Uncharacterized protein n=1 Tax=Theileria orientalis TaxID=68886 RepID=A0A976QSP6_THEOR|nr:hypothetical protein MACJ_002925 [Theileria orientalis]